MIRQGVRLAAIGLASTLAYLVLFLLLRNWAGAQVSNLLALLVTAVANLAANRRLTFGVRGHRNVVRQQLQGLVVFAVGLGVTSGSLALLRCASPAYHRSAEVAVLVVANLVATVVRFLLLRAWVFRASDGAAAVAMVEPEETGAHA
jgi:putative flippase GtrA